MTFDLAYDRGENILSVRHSEPIRLGTRKTVVAYFERCFEYWRRHCRGKKVYALVDYDNLTTEPEVVDCYVDQLKRAHEECVISVMRYGGSFDQRTTSRMMAVKLRMPSNVYSTRDEALRTIMGLKDGTLKLRDAAPLSSAVNDRLELVTPTGGSERPPPSLKHPSLPPLSSGSPRRSRS
jgi:hypothetical protein